MSTVFNIACALGLIIGYVLGAAIGFNFPLIVGGVVLGAAFHLIRRTLGPRYATWLVAAFLVVLITLDEVYFGAGAITYRVILILMVLGWAFSSELTRLIDARDARERRAKEWDEAHGSAPAPEHSSSAEKAEPKFDPWQGRAPAGPFPSADTPRNAGAATKRGRDG